MTETLFELKNVEYYYPGGIKAVSGLNLSINKSSRVVLMGANGSGKSTLLMMLDGLIFPSAGTISAYGKLLSEATFNDINFSKNYRRKIGFVFQNPEVQLFCPTVREDIAFGPLNFGISAKETIALVDRIAEDMGITALLDRPPYRLSIGEKKKIAIATALVADPEVIIMDEPTAGLDPATTSHIIDMLIKADSEGKTLITATHDIHIVEELAGVVHVMGKDNTIIASGTPGDILGNNELLHNSNLIHIHPHSHK